MFRSIVQTAPLAVIALLSAAIIATQPARAASASVDELDGGKVPLTVLIDNDKVRVNLLTFPAGYQRSEHFPRRSDQLLVYLDDGHLASVPDPTAAAPAPQSPGSDAAGKPVHCGAIHQDCGPVTSNGTAPADGLEPRGSVSWRPHNATASPIRVVKGYRALYIELKHGTKTSPDPAAAQLPYEQVTGGGAPARTLIDNERLRAVLISFPKDFIRPGNLRRHYDTVIVYIDDGKLADVGPPAAQYAVVQAFSHHPNARAVCDPIKDCDSVAPDGKWAGGPVTLRGTVAWHPKDGYVENLRIGQAYRALYLELKN
jgi:hypothetical protein